MAKHSITLQNTFAEAFPMKASRLIVTAYSKKWALEAANSFTGFATSVIACGCEAGIESVLSPKETPDGRPGVSLLVFSMSEKELAKQFINLIKENITGNKVKILDYGSGFQPKVIQLIRAEMEKENISFEAHCFDFYSEKNLIDLNINSKEK